MADLTDAGGNPADPVDPGPPESAPTGSWEVWHSTHSSPIEPRRIGPLTSIGVVLLIAVVAVVLLWQNELGPFSVNNPTSFQVFASHIGAAYETGGRLEQQLGGTDPTNHAAEVAALQSLLDWTNTETAWLAAHGPEPCYRDLYGTVQQDVTAERAAVVDALDGAQASDSVLQNLGIQELLATQDLEPALVTNTNTAATNCLGG